MAVSGGWNIHVTYPVPGQSENVTAHLEYTDANDIYSINQTLSCFYSTHDFRSVVQFDYGLGSGDIVALVIACIFGTIGLAGMLYGIVVTMNFLFLFFQLIFWIGGNVVNYLREKIDSIVKHIPKAQEESTSSTQKSSIYNTVTHYLTIPAKYYQEAVGGVRSWIQTGKSQPKDTYDMEEQATLIANEHSNYEDEQTTQHILSAVEVENEDRHSIGSSTLFDR
ncbi:hypothetical protein INT44_001501 [Umbelopsis vinacea]|uniref:Uncharacterized protein n=1 Tax=Umbelopsis vinacea TaxID=44442 RepID=A0A8H7PSC1_9FUNG|nr:hypothetical protein INT44_001501 [Umbelopsis vinacea]